MDGAISSVLAEKERGKQVVSIEPGATVAAAVKRMNDERIGSLLVMDGSTLVGIFTERDVLVRVVAAGCDPGATLVRAVMTPNVVTIAAATTIGAAMQLMTKNRWRHLPIVDDEHVIGMVSIGDLTWWMVRGQAHHIDDLERYITSG